MSVREEFKGRFKCSRCGNAHAETRKVAMLGTGLTKIFDLQMNKFFVISCLYCSYSVYYNLDVLDVLFG